MFYRIFQCLFFNFSNKFDCEYLFQNGVAACLTHLEYLSNESKRAALSIVAQCCQHLNPDDFNMLRECFPILADYLSLEVCSEKTFM